MADFNFGKEFGAGATSRGNLLLQKRGQEEQSRQFNVTTGQRNEEQDLRREMAEPGIAAAKESNQQAERDRLSTSQAGRAFLELGDMLQDDPGAFHDEDGDGNPITEIVGPKSAAQQVFRMSVKHGLDAKGVDVLLGMISTNMDVDAKWIENARKEVILRVEKHSAKLVKKGLDDVTKDLESNASAEQTKRDLDKLAAAQSTLTKQKLTQAETHAGADADREAALAQAQGAKPVSKVEELNNLIKVFEEAGEKDAPRAAIDKLYGSDLSSLVKAYGDYSFFAQPGDPIAAGMGRAITQKVKTFTGESKRTQTTPSGTNYTYDNFPTMILLSEGGWINSPSGIEDYIKHEWELDKGVAGPDYTFEKYSKDIMKDFMNELDRGGWLGGK